MGEDAEPQPMVLSRDNIFLIVISLLMIAAGLVYENTQVAMWFGFIIAGYSVVANDSIQTIGTFLASNNKRPWWLLWIFVAGIFVVTHLGGWFLHNGDVSYGRLASKGLEKAPEEFDYLQIAAPIFLLVITHLKMPVSTTFLILSSFATKASTVAKIASKSLLGYFVSFIAAIIAWPFVSKLIKKYGRDEPHKAWTLAQWLTSGFLWAVWLMQDAANIAVFLPRSLSGMQMVIFSVIMATGLGVLLFMKGGRIQSVVTSKTGVTDVRHATIIDAMYAGVLYYFKIKSKMPMSTTWVFLGNLAGRELGLSLSGEGQKMKKVKRMIFRDIAFAAIGLIISLVIATAVNSAFKEAFMPFM